MPSPAFAAVILAGGTGRRVDGADKSAIDLDGRTLLQHTIAAVARATEIVVVGDRVTAPMSLGSPVTFVREDPAYGGPAAALLTGVAALAEGVDTVLVLAVDMPRVTSATVDRLLTAARERDGATLVDARGRQQLAMALLTRPLRAMSPQPGTWHGLPMHKLLADLDLALVESVGDEGRDIDTWADLHDLEP
ncbi:molybdenum cofactor guanylyltransferase [Nocardioides sp.]|uniref:molybdenum cofactor guanylyltransferase n=1 Tax=Nocardioides sp. TaxID=35761 RepID=UPI003D14D865